MPPHPRQNELSKIDAVCIPAAFLLALISLFAGMAIGVSSLFENSPESTNIYFVVPPTLGIVLSLAGWGINKMITSLWDKLTLSEKISYALIQIVVVLITFFGIVAAIFGFFVSRFVLEQDLNELKGALLGGFLIFFSQRIVNLAFVSQRD